MYPEAPSSKNEETEMLLNKTWVPLPMGRKAHLLTLGVVKARAALIAGTTQGVNAQYPERHELGLRLSLPSY